jgi:hypothetical protein
VGDADCLLPPEKKNNCSNETQGNYVADIAFASAKLSFGSVKRIVGDFLFFFLKKSMLLGDAVWCAVSAKAQFCTSFQFNFHLIWSIYMCGTAKSC